MVLKLKDFLCNINDSRQLWISGPLEPQYSSSTKAASLAVITVALQHEVPFISYICEKPRAELRPEGANLERAGLLGTLYSLLYQLLQFNIEDQDVDLSEDRIQQLDGTEDSWPKGLDLLRDFLHHTPQLRHCIIHGLNSLDWSDDTDWCCQLLDILLDHQEKPGTYVNLLLTTNGQSRVLSERIPEVNRCRAVQRIQDVTKRGKELIVGRLHEEPTVNDI